MQYILYLCLRKIYFLMVFKICFKTPYRGWWSSAQMSRFKIQKRSIKSPIVYTVKNLKTINLREFTPTMYTLLFRRSCTHERRLYLTLLLEWFGTVVIIFSIRSYKTILGIILYAENNVLRMEMLSNKISNNSI